MSVSEKIDAIEPAEFQQLLAEAMETCVLEAGATDLEGEKLQVQCETILLRTFRPAFIYVAERIAKESGTAFNGPESAKAILHNMAEVAAERVSRERPRRAVS